MSYATIDGHKIQYAYGIYTLPCLGGDGVSREPAELLVTVEDGKLAAAQGEPLKVTDGEELRGWGSLDGPSYDVRREAGASVSVPRTLIDWVLGSHSEIVCQILASKTRAGSAAYLWVQLLVGDVILWPSESASVDDDGANAVRRWSLTQEQEDELIATGQVDETN